MNVDLVPILSSCHDKLCSVTNSLRLQSCLLLLSEISFPLISPQIMTAPKELYSAISVCRISKCSLYLLKEFASCVGIYTLKTYSFSAQLFTSIPITCILTLPPSRRLIWCDQLFGHMIDTPPLPRRALKFAIYSLVSQYKIRNEIL